MGAAVICSYAASCNLPLALCKGWHVRQMEANVTLRLMFNHVVSWMDQQLVALSPVVCDDDDMVGITVLSVVIRRW